MQATPTFYSQIGQDRFLFEQFFSDKVGGTFVEIGAYDGISLSNTYFFEKTMAWTGICVEPLPSAFQKLRRFRTARCYNCCVSDYEGVADFLDVDVLHEAKMLSGLLENYDPRHVERIRKTEQGSQVIPVQVRKLNNMLAENDLTHVDYCSIDTEGSEMKILASIDFSRFTFDYLSVENNYKDPEYARFMDAKGFDLIHVFEEYDELYERRGVNSPPSATPSPSQSNWDNL